MGTGKSTVGRLLAQKLGYQLVDTDVIIEETSGKTIPEIFAEEGEAAFRQLERETAVRLAAQSGLLISTGGGMMLDPANGAVFRPTCDIFCLTAPAEEILRRVLADEGQARPLLNVPDPRGRILELLTARAEKYGQYTQIDTMGKTPEQIADEIVGLCARA